MDPEALSQFLLTASRDQLVDLILEWDQARRVALAAWGEVTLPITLAPVAAPVSA